MILSLGFIEPVSTRPTGTVPTPVIEYTSCIGKRRGLPVGFSGTLNSSNVSRRVLPLYHGIFSDFFTRFSPVQPDTGINGTVSTLKPTDFTSCSPFSFAAL